CIDQGIAVINYGVSGRTITGDFGAAGVYGNDRGTGTPLPGYPPAGVRGETRGSTYGVLGVSQREGVTGSVFDNSGAELAYGILAFHNPTTYGVFAGGNFGGTGAKYFVEPPPTDSSMVIRYVALEGPEAGTFFRGKARFQNGFAAIEVPEDFRLVTDPEGLSIQVTPIGEFANVAVVRIA